MEQGTCASYVSGEKKDRDYSISAAVVLHQYLWVGEGSLTVR